MAKSLDINDITVSTPSANPDGWFPDHDNRDDADPWDDNDPWNH
jgi:hypothetical protein